MVAFLLITLISHATPALAEENFGVGADVEIEVERATQQTTVIVTETWPSWVYVLVGLILGSILTLLLVKSKMRRVTATKGGEKLG